MNVLEDKLRTALRETGEEIRRRNTDRQPLSTADRT